MPVFSDYPQLKIIQDIAKKKKLAIYLIGGFLRDHALRSVLSSTDFDFAVERDALKMAKAFAVKIKGAFVLLDQEHGCARVVKKRGEKIFTFDFANFRAKTFRGDLAHRDFTINTLSLDLARVGPTTEIDDVLIDLRKGIRDLAAKCIKQNSVRVFKEDPLRMLRAFSLKATLNFKIEKETLQQIKKDRDLIQDVSYERIREEVFKVLKSHRGASTLKVMHRIGLLERVFPQIRVMFDCKQGGYHHLNVWAHSLETIVQLEKILKGLDNDDGEILNYFNECIGGGHSRAVVMKLAALLHDIGKPDTRVKKGERLSFHGHEHVGKNIARAICQMMKLSANERHAIEDMISLHLRPGYLSNFKSPSERMFFRYFRDAKQEAASIAFLSLADQRATRGPLTTEKDQQHHEDICKRLVKRYFIQKHQQPSILLINGKDLIRKIKLKPSPLFGKILKEIEELQALGKIKTKVEAMDLVKRIIKR